MKATTKYTAKIPVWAIPALFIGQVFDFEGPKAAALDSWVIEHPGFNISITGNAETEEARPEFGPAALCVTAEITYNAYPAKH